MNNTLSPKLFNSKMSTILIFLLVWGAMFLFLIFYAQAESSLSFSYQCTRFGHGNSKTCNSDGTKYLDSGYAAYSLSFSLSGHRHGDSRVSYTICMRPNGGGTGECRSWLGAGYLLGPEWGGNEIFHINGLYDSDTFSGYDSSGYFIFYWIDVKDATATLSGNGSTVPFSSGEPPIIEPPPKEVPPPGVFDCQPRNQTVGVGQSASFTAYNGDGNYKWDANDGNPSSGTGTNFSTSYPKPDTGKTVRLRDGGSGYAECYVVIKEGYVSPGGGGGPPPVPVCGDGAVQGWESCDKPGKMGACPNDCSASCTWNSCGSCELPSSPYFSQQPEDLTTYARRLENGTCYRGGALVDSRCYDSTNTSQVGRWVSRGNDWTNPNQAYCNHDNLCYGCYMGRGYQSNGELQELSELTCERRYSCLIDNFPPPPVINFTCNGSSTCTIPYNSSATLSWTSTNATSCTASGDWSGGQPTSGSNPTGNLTSNKQYKLTCSGLGGSTTNIVDVTVLAPPPIVVDIKCNGLDSCTVPYNGSASLTWTTSGLFPGDTCTASGDWSGGQSQSGGPNVFNNITMDKSYTITCSRVGVGDSNFDTVNVVVNIPEPVISDPPGPEGGVTVSVNNSYYCSAGPHATIDWTYSDPIGLNQIAYQISIDDDGSPDNGGEEYESGVVASTIPNGGTGSVLVSGCNTSNPTIDPQKLCRMTWNKTYQAWIKVENKAGRWSNWTLMNRYCNNGSCGSATSWSIPIHAFPAPSFTYSPSNPATSSPVKFTDGTTFAVGSINRAWSWNFGGGIPGSATGQGPHTNTYYISGAYTASLTASDDVGSCTTSLSLNIQRGIPQWREVLPK